VHVAAPAALAGAGLSAQSRSGATAEFPSGLLGYFRDSPKVATTHADLAAIFIAKTTAAKGGKG
jgi:hypothetical protein